MERDENKLSYARALQGKKGESLVNEDTSRHARWIVCKLIPADACVVQ